MEDAHRAPEEEAKVSSSSLRKRQLGQLRTPPTVSVVNRVPHLTGTTRRIVKKKKSYQENRAFGNFAKTEEILYDQVNSKAYIPLRRKTTGVGYFCVT